jgi:hypothetical protein
VEWSQPFDHLCRVVALQARMRFTEAEFGSECADLRDEACRVFPVGSANITLPKEDILEQLFDDYLKTTGFFTIHNVKFKPLATDPE